MPTVSGIVYDDTGAPVAGRIVRAYQRDTGALLGQTVTVAGGGAAADSGFDADLNSANVLLLLLGNGTNGSTTITDSSSFNRAVNEQVGVTLSTAVKKFGTASLSFNGGGKFISYLGSYTALSDTYTLECWVNPSSVTGNGGICQKMYWFNVGGGSSTTDVALRRVGTGLQCFLEGTTNATLKTIDVTNIFSVGVWTHLALVRNGTSATLFVDGVSKGTVSGLTPGGTRTEVMKIGRFTYSDPSPVYEEFNGYIDDFRLTNSVARYTSNFVAPGTPKTDSNLAAVSLLLHFEGTTVADSSSYGHVSNGERSGYVMTQAEIGSYMSTTRKFGNKALNFVESPGSSQAYYSPMLRYLPHSSFAFGTGDFTVEFWVMPTGVTINTTVSYDQPGSLVSGVINGGGQYAHNWSINIHSYYGLSFIISGTSTVVYVPGFYLPVNVWSHLAFVRAAGVLHIFVDGVEKQVVTGDVGSTPSLGKPLTTYLFEDIDPPYLYVGQSLAYTATRGCSARYDELRITKGLARYTSDFAVQTEPFPDMNTTDGVPGGYTISTTYNGEVQVVCLDNAAGTVYNDLIHRTTPV